jgi:hypothetical protein
MLRASNILLDGGKARPYLLPVGQVSVVDKSGKRKFVTQTKHREIRERSC